MRCELQRAVLAGALLTLLSPLASLSQAQPTTEEAAAALRFDILEFVVVGNTMLEPLAIEKAVYPFLGPGRSVADAEGARKALEKAYQDAGFLSVTVDIPPQRVGERGELRLVVVEAKVDRLRVTGARYHLPSAVAAEVPSLAPDSVPNFNDMQDELARLARQTSNREVTPLIAAGDVPGTMNVELKVQDSLPLSAFAELNSKQSVNTERGRFEASLSYDNLFQRQHSLGAYWFVSPRDPEQANILSLTYHAPLGGPDDQLYVLWTKSDSNTPTSLGGATVARGTTWGLRWRDALIGPPGMQHALTWGFKYSDLQDRNDAVAGFTVESPPMRYPSFSVQYELIGVDAATGRQTTFDAGLNFSIAALSRREVDCNGHQVDQFECKRSGAKPGFQVLTLAASHREPLFKDWSLFVRGQAQLTLDPLVPSEQSVQGGIDTVRGYFESEQSGDDMLGLRVELSTPRFGVGAGAGLRALTFFDRAMLKRISPLPGELSIIQMGGIGLGLRVDTAIGLQVRFDWARALFDTQQLDSAGALQPVTNARDTRWELGIRQTF